MTDCTEILPPKIDLGPLFVDKDAGVDSEPEDNGDEFFESDDAFTLKVDLKRLKDAIKKLRGYWLTRSL